MRQRDRAALVLHHEKARHYRLRRKANSPERSAKPFFNSGEKTVRQADDKKRLAANLHHTAALRIPRNLRKPITSTRYGKPPATAKPYLPMSRLAVKGGASGNPSGIGGISGGAGGVGGSSSTRVRHNCRS